MAASVAHDDARHLDATAVAANSDDERAVGCIDSGNNNSGSDISGCGHNDTDTAAINPTAAAATGDPCSPECPAGFANVIGVTALPKPQLDWGGLQEEGE